MSESASFYQDPKTVDIYFQISEGIDGRNLVAQLEKFLAPGASILEIGMGPGKDLDILSENYKVTGSDFSTEFLNRYRKLHPKAKLLELDATQLNTDQTFDAIYSNKVLHHLTLEELHESIENQAKILNPGGVVCHSFWEGTGEETMKGLYSKKYKQDELQKIFEKDFNVLYWSSYGELGTKDSLLIIGKLKKKGLEG